jgi:hypothetical protein
VHDKKLLLFFGRLSAGAPSFALFPPSLKPAVTSRGLKSTVAKQSLCRPSTGALIAHWLIVTKPPNFCFSSTIWQGGTFLRPRGGGGVLSSFSQPSPHLSPVGSFVHHTLHNSVVAFARGGGHSTFPLIAASVFRALSRTSSSLAFTSVSSSLRLSI